MMSIPFIPGEPSWLESLLKPAAQSFGSGIQSGIAEAFQQDKQRKNLMQAQEQIGELDENSSQLDIFKALQRIQDPNIRTEFANFAQRTLLSPKKAQGIPARDSFLNLPRSEQIDLVNNLLEQGQFDTEEEAFQFLASTPGGRTALTKEKIRERQKLKGPKKRDITVQDVNPKILNEKFYDPEYLKNNYQKLIWRNADFEIPEIDTGIEGLDDKERSKVQSDYRKENAPVRTELRKSIKNREVENRNINRLDQINERRNLPENFVMRALYDATSSKALRNAIGGPDAELWEKTLKEFTTNVKDSFGGNITNFELGVFQQRFPSVSNTYEGRKLIIEQMKIINSIDRLHDRALNNVYRQYGVENISAQDAKDLADKAIEPQLDILLNQYENIFNILGDMENNVNKNQSKGFIETTKDFLITSPQDKVQQANRNVANQMVKPIQGRKSLGEIFGS